MITSEQLDELFKRNNITAEDIISINSEISSDAFEYDDWEIDEDGFACGGASVKNIEWAWDCWLESLWDNDEFIKLLTSLGNFTEKEKEDIMDGEVELENSKIMNTAFDKVLQDSLSAYAASEEDSRAYESDPYSYYGVSPSDFV